MITVSMGNENMFRVNRRGYNCPAVEKNACLGIVDADVNEGAEPRLTPAASDVDTTRRGHFDKK